MNEDHADAVAGYARSYAAIAGVLSASMHSMDALGMDLEVQTADGRCRVRIAFDHVLLDAEDAKQTLIRMAMQAR
jgi:putative heme iron utilization protein